jgi:4'-phosphopantetheinyl transferase EntD
VPLEPAALECRLSEDLGIRCSVAVADKPAPLSSLSPAERRRVAALGSSSRADSYRLGRAACKALLARLGENPAIDELVFPHNRFSLTHSGGVAIAFAIGGESPAGAGIDFETCPGISDQAERFYLLQHERRWLRLPSRPRVADERLRLWTVKEALFKADLDNSGTVLSDYATADPSAASGWAAPSPARDRPGAWLYASLPVEGGFLTAAAHMLGRTP